MSKLDSHQIDQALRQTPGWRRSGDAITRTFSLPSFPAALLFAAAVGHLAERAEHHPDMLIQYRSVTLTLSTHSAGGLTDKDFALAAAVNAIEP
jgi:4a-hydroxytetrahydrobiopterin dehydratase